MSLLNLFPTCFILTVLSSFSQDRLVSLDSAEDFVRLAKEKYPQQSRLRDNVVKKEDI